MRKKSWGEYRKSILDILIEKIRLSIVTKNIKMGSILDLGCGYDAGLLKLMEADITNGVGVDISINKNFDSKKIKLIESKIDRPINLAPGSFDNIIAMAVIEHLDHPKIMLSESFRLLKKGGTLLITTPSIQSRALLEFLANINIISRHEIGDHKRYYDKQSLFNELVSAGFKTEKIEIKYFEAGLNIFARATK